jgi:hypothetical protein
MEPPAPETSPSAFPKSAKVNWPLVFALLLGPAVLALTGALLNLDTLAVACPFGGSIISGLIFGVIMARRFGKAVLARVLLGFCCAAIFGCLTLGLACVGCAFGGGFKLD